MQLRVQQVNTLSIPHPNLHTNNSILKFEMELYFGCRKSLQLMMGLWAGAHLVKVGEMGVLQTEGQSDHLMRGQTSGGQG